MSSLSSLVTALLVLHQVLIAGPSGTSTVALDRASVVATAHQACRKMLAHEALEGVDLVKFAKENITIKEEAPSEGEDGTALKIIKTQIDMKDALDLFFALCDETPNAAIITDEVLEAAKREYAEIIASIPPARNLRELRFKEATLIESAGTDPSIIGLWHAPNAKRSWIKLSSLPPHIPQAWVSAEDKSFWTHKGVDQDGIMRAFVKMFIRKGRPQGGSTITQQVAKNLLVGDDLTVTRKLREMIAAQKIEREFTKEEILEIYLNYIYLGRQSHGIEMAAQAYFGKSASQINLAEAALLAGLTHGPNLYDFVEEPDRAIKRRAYVLDRLQKDQAIMPDQIASARLEPLGVIPFVNINDYEAPYFVSKLKAEATEYINEEELESGGYTIKSTIDSEMQDWAKTALQEGLFSYEALSKRNTWRGPIKNISAEIAAIESKEAAARQAAAEKAAELEAQRQRASGGLFALAGAGQAPTETASPAEGTIDGNDFESPKLPSWQLALLRFRNPAPDASHWQIAVVNEVLSRSGTLAMIGLENGESATLVNEPIAGVGRNHIAEPLSLNKGDVIYVTAGGDGNYNLRQVPEAQGAIVAMEHATGKIRAMHGGFSHSLSEYNRAVFAKRQPGSLLKAFAFLAAYQSGMQPNYHVDDNQVYLRREERGASTWAPHNYDGEYWGYIPISRGLEYSRNLVTAQIMRIVGIDAIRNIAEEFGLYDKAERFYPFVIGAQETSLLRMVLGFSQIANGGNKLTPVWFDDIRDRNGRIVVNGAVNAMRFSAVNRIQSVDAISIFQTSHNLQSVVLRGTGARAGKLANMIAGKTGTTDNYRDAWFVGYSNKYTVGVWVGYDGERNLEPKFAGSQVSLPIAAEVLGKTLIRDGALNDRLQERAGARDFAYINQNVPYGVEMLVTAAETGWLNPMSSEKIAIRPFRSGYSKNPERISIPGYADGMTALWPQLPLNSLSGTFRPGTTITTAPLPGLTDDRPANTVGRTTTGDGRIEIFELPPPGTPTEDRGQIQQQPRQERRTAPVKPRMGGFDDATEIDKLLQGIY